MDPLAEKKPSVCMVNIEKNERRLGERRSSSPEYDATRVQLGFLTSSKGKNPSIVKIDKITGRDDRMYKIGAGVDSKPFVSKRQSGMVNY